MPHASATTPSSNRPTSRSSAARRGLEQLEVDYADRDDYLEVIEARVRGHRTGADWQRGWVARWQLVDGTVVTKNVTSDPFNPNTDGDGFNDNSEKALSLDPRDWDTDGDLLEDEFEYNHLFANPAHQDSDGDGIVDGSDLD